MAKTGITYSIQKQLANYAANKKILDGTYLSDINNENFAEIVTHLYPNQTERAKLLNPGSYLGNIIGDKIKNFVGEADTEFDINYDTIVEGILIRGQIFLKYENKADGSYTARELRAETYYQDGDLEMIARIYPVYDSVNGYGTVTNYLYVQSYNGKILKNTLYKIASVDNLSDGDIVDLNTIYELSHLEPVQHLTNLPRLVEVVDIIDRPMMDTIKTIIYSVDRKLAEAEKHFNDYSEQFKLFQNIDIPKSAYSFVNGTKVINWDKLGKIVRTQDYSAVGDIKIIKNGNELLDAALKQVDKQVEQISSISDIPLEFFGVQTVRDSGSGKEVGSANLFKRINKYRDKIDILLNKAFDFLSKFQDVDKSIIREAIIRASEMDIITQQTLLLQNNMTSLVRAIKVVHGVSEEQALLIIEEIKQDQSNGLLVSIKEQNQQADSLAKTKSVTK